MLSAYAPRRGSRLSGKTREGISQGKQVKNLEGQDRAPKRREEGWRTSDPVFRLIRDTLAHTVRFQKGQPRPEKAGRRAGTPNKSSQEVGRFCRDVLETREFQEK
jgi:hypothetical protein